MNEGIRAMSNLRSLDSDFEIIDQPLSNDELQYLRDVRHDDDYMPALSVDAIQESFSDKQLRWLGPFLRCQQAPEPETLCEIMSTHPVNLARPGQGCERFAIVALIRYCSKMGPSWSKLKISAETWLSRLDDGTFADQIGRRKPR